MKAPEPKEIREAYADFLSEWNDIQEEGKTDMRYVAGDPWEAKDRKAREDAGRPCISLDELNQYLNQAINNVRQNKRAIQVIPKGDGSNDTDAERRANIIRGIEYHSQAQAAYITAFENALQRGYGFAGLETAYEADDTFDQEIRVRRFANPDCVIIDPHYKKADASDISRAFVVDLIRKSEFKRKFGKTAKIQSFTGEHMAEAPAWIRENYVQTAEFWQLEKTPRTLLLIDGGQSGPIIEFEDKLKGREGLTILKERKTETSEVMQYFTNGLEVLEEAEWVGSRIPIAACFGKEIYVDDGGGAKRVLLSMVRLARDAQMLLAYLATQECEEAGMTPKAPFVGFKGQFESDQEAWEFLNKIPRSYVQVDLVPDGAQGMLPLPTRPNFVPNFESYELAKDSARRSIQAAMGISPETTAMQRNNQKSGIALEKLQNQASIGSFHFTDNYDGFIGNLGWQINEAVDEIYDTARTLPVTKKDGTHSVMRVNDPPYVLQNPNKDHLAIRDEQGEKTGQYGATVSTGPSYDSQREQASSFVDLLLQNLQQLPVPPNIATQILALAIRLKDIGPIGEQIAQLLTPPDQSQMPPQAQAAIAQAQGIIQQLQQELAKLTMEKDAKVLDHKARIEVEKLRQETAIAMEKLKIEADLAKSEVGTKAQILRERESIVADVMTQLRDHAHDFGLQAHAHEHEEGLAEAQQQIAAEAAASAEAQSQPQAGQ